MDHKELVSKLSSVHQSLRSRRRETEGGEWDRVWKEYKGNVGDLKEYAATMHKLATEVWEMKNSVSVSEGKDWNEFSCRIDWVYCKCVEYFNLEESVAAVDLGRSNSKAAAAVDLKLKLLDIGSCYNPFRKYGDVFSITAVDLCPAPGLEGEVYQADFLELDLLLEDWESELETLHDSSEEEERLGKLLALRVETFDVAVLSFVLEYLPDKLQRLECCRKASAVLKTGGVLFILRPDSSKEKPKRNCRLVKGLKVGLGFLGLRRIFLEKRAHLWCMGFVKMEPVDRQEYICSPRFVKDIAKARKSFDFCQDFDKESDKGLENLFAISQDSWKEEVQVQSEVEIKRVEVDPQLFNELPNLDSEDESL